MKKAVYEKYIKGCSIRHASILNDGMMSFFMQTSQDETAAQKPVENLPFRVVLYTPNIRKEDDGFSYYHWKKGVKNAFVHIGTHITIAETFGTVWESRTDDKWHKATTDTDKKAGWITGLKQIGDTLFACGNQRKIYRRDGFRNWIDLVDYQTHDYVYEDIVAREDKGEKHFGYPMGFTCFDGFCETDIYAGGTYGAFWRYDGARWHCVDLKTNKDVVDIVCAPNDLVYVVMGDGQIIVGREDDWHASEYANDSAGIHPAGATSAAWFNGKLYLASPSDLYAFDGQSCVKYVFPENGPRQMSFGWVTSCDTALLSYGPEQAFVFDGQEWTEVVGSPSA